jgi:SNF2 family DNA or RNA helicase
VKIYIRKKGKRIVLRSAYHPAIPDQCKAVPGWGFSREGGAHWTYPLSLESCRGLRTQFGASLVVDAELWDWAKAEAALRRKMRKLAGQMDAHLEYVPTRAPALARALATRTYQRTAAAFIAHMCSALIADQPGTGKTLESLAGIVEAKPYGLFLIVAPKTSLKLVWGREIQRWLPDARCVVAPEGWAARGVALDELVTGYVHGTYNFMVVNHDMIGTKTINWCDLCDDYWSRECADMEHGEPKFSHYEHKHPELFAYQWDGAIVDESQEVLVAKSLKTPTQRRTGAMLLPIKPNGVRIALSGTPMRGKPHQLWGTLNWLRPKEYASKWAWLDTHFEQTKGTFSTLIGEVPPQREAAYVQSLTTVMLRRTKAEVCPELPPKQYGGSLLDPNDAESPVGLWVPMAGKQRAAYKSMAEMAFAALGEHRITATGVLAEFTRLKQFATAYGRMEPDNHGQLHFRPEFPSNKFDHLVDMLHERGIRGGASDEGAAKIIVASQFTEIIDMFAAMLQHYKIGSHRITGKVSGRARVRAVDLFQSADLSARVILINHKAGGTTITLDAADDLVFIDELWIPDDQEQVEDRAHRTSRIHQVNIYYMRSEGTVEEYIANTNRGRDIVQKRLMDGSRGVAYARKLIQGKVRV